MFRLSSVIFAALLFFAFSAGTADARVFHIKFGAWSGKSYFRDDGSFSHCAVSARYKRGDLLVFSINSKYLFSIGVFDKRWNLTKGNRYPVRLIVDNDGSISRTARALSSRQIGISINDRKAFFNFIRFGKTLRIQGKGFSRSYSLRGTKGVLVRTLRCVNAFMKNGSGGGGVDSPESSGGGSGTDSPQPEADSPESSSSNQPRNTFNSPQPVARTNTTPVPATSGVLPRTVVLGYATNMLTNLGMSGYKFINIAAFAKRGYKVSWRYPEGQIGAMAAYRGTSGNFVEAESAGILAKDAGSCRGQFASGYRQTQKDQRWTGRRLFTACRNSADGNDYIIHYSVGRQPSGTGIIVATVILLKKGAGDEGNGQGAGIDKSIFESPGFREIGN